MRLVKIVLARRISLAFSILYIFNSNFGTKNITKTLIANQTSVEIIFCRISISKETELNIV